VVASPKRRYRPAAIERDGRITESPPCWPFLWVGDRPDRAKDRMAAQATAVKVPKVANMGRWSGQSMAAPRAAELSRRTRRRLGGRAKLGSAGCRPAQVSATDLRRFEAAFEQHHGTVLAFALRRTQSEADAEDAVAETFAVAWRRVDRLPEADVALPWLLATARRILANQRRGAGRRLRLSLRLRAQPQHVPAVHAVETPALEALARLRPDDQELLRLLVWDGLSQAEAGEVLGITANAVGIRLSRARKRFAEQLRLVKGLDPDRTSSGVEGRTPGYRSREGSA
jgi:RNA polymerase sigma factor (sigma-70 family)